MARGRETTSHKTPNPTQPWTRWSQSDRAVCMLHVLPRGGLDRHCCRTSPTVAVGRWNTREVERAWDELLAVWQDSVCLSQRFPCIHTTNLG